MSYSPKDIMNYVIEKGLEFDFMAAIARHVMSYSIAEITDKGFVEEDGTYRLKSKIYSMDLELEDDEILTAVKNGIYVSVFLSRHENDYQVHFLVHKYPETMKSQFEEEITEEVIHYMIMKTILILRLDTPEKIENYVGNGDGSFGGIM